MVSGADAEWGQVQCRLPGVSASCSAHLSPMLACDHSTMNISLIQPLSPCVALLWCVKRDWEHTLCLASLHYSVPEKLPASCYLSAKTHHQFSYL